MNGIRRVIAALGASALLTLVTIPLATPAQAADSVPRADAVVILNRALFEVMKVKELIL